MTPFLKRILYLAMLSLLGLALTGCGSKPNPELVAQCMADRASPDEVWRYGTQIVGSGSVLVARWDPVGCEGGWKVAMDNTARAAVADTLPKLLVTKADFRGGAYSALLGPEASRDQRKAVAELGLKLEEFANRREEALNCLGAPASRLGLMAEADLAFATAVTGSRGGVADPEAAKALAGELVPRAISAAALNQLQMCEGEKDTEFRAYAAELQSFMDGKHPWAPGCRMVMNADDLQLTCSGAETRALPPMLP